MAIEIGRVAVVGAGTMGHGIAQVCAQTGRCVTLIDVNQKVLQDAQEKIQASVELMVINGLLPRVAADGLPDRIIFATDLAEAKHADIVFEAIPERVNLKKDLFAQLDIICSEKTIFASNTSGLPVNLLAGFSIHPERVVGTHFYMPAQLIPLVEVIQGEKTDKQLLDKVLAFLSSAGKKPVHVKYDIPGFIGNRLQHAIAREAMSLVEKGVATVEDIDTVVKSSLALRMVFSGPLEQRDLNGLDTHLSITEYLYRDLEDSKEPLAILKDKVALGQLGLKSGKGFYDWSGKPAGGVSARKNQQLIDLLKLLTQEG